MDWHDIWLSTITVAGGAVTGFLTWLKLRETSQVREIRIKLQVADEARAALVSRVAALELERGAMQTIAARREELIEVMKERLKLQRQEILALTRMVGKYEKAAHEAVIETDQDGTILLWDAAATIMFGWTVDEVIGRDVSELIVPPETRQQHRDGLEKFRYSVSSPHAREQSSRVRVQPLTTMAINRNGERFPVEVQLFPPWKTGERSWRVAARVRRLELPAVEAVAAGMPAIPDDRE